MSEQKGEIRIYVACLAAYNNGQLHGRWIDACQEEAAIRDDIKAMLKASPIPNAEEFAIHGYEGFEGASVEEYSSIHNVVALAQFISDNGALGGKLLGYYGNLDDAENAFNDHYYGELKSVAEFAQELTEQTTEIPSSLEFYIDYDRMARDLEINDILSIETGFEEVHIFWQH